ncbi:hypothetical protein ES703_55956 [subsurface metagenome]
MKEKSTLEKLEEFKKSSGWSYLQLAVAMGIHYQTINNWFVKKAKPSPMALEKIQKFLRSVEKSGTPGDLSR